jgi:hypothetical protein
VDDLGVSKEKKITKGSNFFEKRPRRRKKEGKATVQYGTRNNLSSLPPH